jgi:lipopolysaccharide biosynthesis glycosyltransferase
MRSGNNNGRDVSMNIASVSDSQYALCATITFLSIVSNTKAFVRFFLIDVGIPEPKKRMIQNTLAKYSNCSLEFIPVNEVMFAKIADMRLREHTHITKAAYAKLLFQYLLPDLDKVLYVDGDILATDDFADIYATDISACFLAACPDWGGDIKGSAKARLRLSDSARYFNSGLMLINLKKWREANVFPYFKAWYRQFHYLMLLHDQEVLNGVFADKVRILDARWNIQRSIMSSYFIENAEGITMTKGAYHFTGAFKPWRDNYESAASPGQGKVFKEIYQGYRNQIEMPTSELVRPITVVGVTDNGYALPYLIAFMSLLENTREPVNIVLLDLGLLEENQFLLRQHLASYPHCSLEFKILTDSEINVIKKFKSSSIGHVTNATYGRLLIPKLFADFQKVLYIDGDTMFTTDVKELWDSDLDGYYLGATGNSNVSIMARRIGLGKAYGYFNAGVLLFNIESFKGSDFLSRCEKWSNLHYGDTRVVDQDILNGVLAGVWRDVGNVWNVPYSNGMYDVAPDVFENAKIVHFLTSKKPWRNDYAQNNDKHIAQYRQYLRKIKKGINQ